jgi:AcrR family transcriptional regulator
MASRATATRPYRGISPEERRAARREQLLDAGLEVFGTEGYAESSVRRICEVAGLNQRYFYESFETREELLAAVYERICEETRDAMITAVVAVEPKAETQARAGLTAWWRTVTGDRRKARVLSVEVVGASERIERRRREIRHSFASFIVAQLNQLTDGRSDRSGLDVEGAARGLVAANIDLVVDWMRGDVPDDVDALIEHVTKLFIFLASAAFPSEIEPPERT